MKANTLRLAAMLAMIGLFVQRTVVAQSLHDASAADSDGPMPPLWALGALGAVLLVGIASRRMKKAGQWTQQRSAFDGAPALR